MVAFEYLKASSFAFATPFDLASSLVLASPLVFVDALLVGAVALEETFRVFAVRGAVGTSSLALASAIALRLGGIEVNL